MLKFLLWLNRNLIKFIDSVDKRIERHLEYKNIKKMIKDKWSCIDILKCKDGIIILIRENEQSMKAVDWIQKNILTEQEKEEDNSDILKDTPGQVEEELSENTELKQSYKISNIKLAFQNTNGVKTVSSHVVQKTTDNTSDFIEVKTLNKEDNETNGNYNYKCTKDSVLRCPFRIK